MSPGIDVDWPAQVSDNLDHNHDYLIVCLVHYGRCCVRHTCPSILRIIQTFQTSGPDRANHPDSGPGLFMSKHQIQLEYAE